MAAIAAILKTNLFLLRLNRKANWLEVSDFRDSLFFVSKDNPFGLLLKLSSKYQDVDYKKLNLFRSEIQDGRYGHHFEKLFPWIEKPIDSKLDRKYRGDLYIKIS